MYDLRMSEEVRPLYEKVKAFIAEEVQPMSEKFFELGATRDDAAGAVSDAAESVGVDQGEGGDDEAGEQPAEVGERRLGGILGEHRDAMCRPEAACPVGVEEQVRAPVERVVDLPLIQRGPIAHQRRVVDATDGEP